MRPPLLAVFLTVLALVVGGAALALGLGGPELVRGAIATELAARGFPDARFEVDGVGWRHVSLSELRLAPDLVIDEVEITTDASGLLGAHVESITLVGAQWTIAPDEEALRSSSLARLGVGGDGGEAAPPRVQLRRSRIVIDREGGAIPIELEGDVLLAEARATLTLRSSLGEHALTARATQNAGETRIDASLRSQTGDRVDLSVRGAPGEHSPIAWTLAARFRAALLEHVAPELELEGRARLDASGLARRSKSSGWALEHVALTAKIDAVGAPAEELALESVRAALHLGVSAHDGAVQIDVDDHSQLYVGLATLSDWRAEQLTLSPRVRIEVEGDATRVRLREPIEARLRALAVGRGKGTLSAERVALTLASHRGRPLLERTAQTTRAALRLEGSAPRITGALH
nr:hypothetical protein [Myxococcota bacterium]